jgi:hypothetical protein
VSPFLTAIMLAILPNLAKARSGWEFEEIHPESLKRCSGCDSRTITHALVCKRVGKVITPRHCLARA